MTLSKSQKIKQLPFIKWQDAYIKNANKDLKQMIPTSEMCKQVNMEYEQIINNLVDVYTLTIEKAEMYMKKYY